MAMKVVRQARLELSGGSTPDLLRPPPSRPRAMPQVDCVDMLTAVLVQGC